MAEMQPLEAAESVLARSSKQKNALQERLQQLQQLARVETAKKAQACDGICGAIVEVNVTISLTFADMEYYGFRWEERQSNMLLAPLAVVTRVDESVAVNLKAGDEIYAIGKKRVFGTAFPQFEEVLQEHTRAAGTVGGNKTFSMTVLRYDSRMLDGMSVPPVPEPAPAPTPQPAPQQPTPPPAQLQPYLGLDQYNIIVAQLSNAHVTLMELSQQMAADFEKRNETLVACAQQAHYAYRQLREAYHGVAGRSGAVAGEQTPTSRLTPTSATHSRRGTASAGVRPSNAAALEQLRQAHLSAQHVPQAMHAQYFGIPQYQPLQLAQTSNHGRSSQGQSLQQPQLTFQRQQQQWQQAGTWSGPHAR